ncbi:DUF2971 domain-containing protein [Sphingobacterium kitahiroshimense]|uniref:DUF2971 domain-containing protein n=1 Tax=Sphingobacterium kitahiroshimense TaxID=470446 RepID=A0ABV0C159_9SPHI
MDIIKNITDLATHLENNPVNYKYYSADVALTALKKKTLQFTHPNGFNDPFDSNVNLFKFDKDDVTQYVVDVINKHKISEDHGAYMYRQLQTLVSQNPKEYMQNIFDEENLGRGITCFSKKFNQMQMWAHYADKHKGICIGYDLFKIKDTIADVNKESAFIPVNYVNEIVALSNFTDINTIFHWFGTKHSFWSYEEEVRLISRPFDYSKENKCLFPIQKENVIEIYCGYNINEIDLNNLKDILRSDYPHVKLFQIQPDYDAFTLEREEICF